MRASEAGATHALLAALQWIEVDDQLAERVGILAIQFLRSRPDIDAVDYVITAKTDSLGAELRTLNVRHFPMFPWLNPPY